VRKLSVAGGGLDGMSDQDTRTGTRTGRSRTPVAERSNPVHGFAGAGLAAVDQVAGSPAWAMTPAEQAETLVELEELATRIGELKLRVLASAERNEVGAEEGAMSVAVWLAARTRQVRTRTHRELRAARALDEVRLAPTQYAYATGRLTEDQMWVILTCVHDLPTAPVVDPVTGETGHVVTDDDIRAVQEHLIALASEHDAKTLRVLARRVFEVIAPGEADRREKAALEAEERRARQTCRFATRDNGDGTVSGWFKLPTLTAAILNKAVTALAAPRRTDPEAWHDDHGRPLPYPVLLGQAFAELVEHLPTDKLPHAGGVPATLIITMTLHELLAGIAGATLENGDRISAGEVRRTACNAGTIPAILDGQSVPLDLGREQRLFSPYQRRAMHLRDKGCTTQGCDRPPHWCEAHHDHEWAHGGRTDLTQGRLLCPRHHQHAHDDRYDMHHLPDGKVRFHRRT
jgi:hypothetical protein